MSIHNFLSSENLTLIWSIIVDEEITKSIDLNQLKIMFNNNLKGFNDFEVIKSKSLIEMNKKYIKLMLDYITNLKKQNIENTKNDISNISKIKIEQITHDEIQSEKLNQFDKDLNLRKQEFDSLINKSIPAVPKFSDKIDEPIHELDKIIKDMTAQRNYDIEQINYKNNSNEWLTSTKTSIKNEKIQPKPPPHTQTQTQPLIKTIKIDKKNIESNLSTIIDLNQNKKNVTWSNNDIPYIYNDNYNDTDNDDSNNNKDNIFNNNSNLYNDDNENEENIFKKLKKINFQNNVSKIETLQEEIKQLNNKVIEIDNNIKNILELLKK